MKRILIIVTTIILVSGPMIGVANASLSVTGSSGNLSASADFLISGSNLVITLANTSTADVLVPADLLTAVFFSIQGVTLTPVSAVLTPGSITYFGPSGGGNVGGEWAYAANLSGAPYGATQGISTAGFGLFGRPNFNGSNLEHAKAVQGLNYAITSLGDNTGTGNKPVTGGVPLISNSVEFTLSGLPGDFSYDRISDVSFQYGTALSEPNIQTPEPSILLLLGTGLVGIGTAAWRKVKK